MTLSLYHTFSRHGRNYLINGDRMTVHEIDDQTGRFLAGLRSRPLESLSDIERDRAIQLQLIRRAAGKKSVSSPGESVPVTDIALIVTRRCNFGCVYCYEAKEQVHDNGEMTEKTAYRAVDWLIENSGDSKKLSLTFFGGEPLLRFDLLKKITAYADRRGMEHSKSFGFFFSTNGSLLSRKVVDFASCHRIGVQVSMDGPPDIQNAARPFANGRGSYDIVAANIQKALESGRIEISCRATVINGRDLGRIRNELRRIGFKRIKMQLATLEEKAETGNGTGAPERDCSGMAAVAEQDASDLLYLVKERKTPQLKDMWHTFSIYESLHRFLRPIKKTLFCNAGRSYLAVTPEGRIFLCHRFADNPGFGRGSIFDGDFCNPCPVQARTEAQTPCRRCFARYFCGGGCYHDNLTVNGAIEIPAKDQCRLVRQQVEWAAWAAACLSGADIDYLENQGLVPARPWFEDLF